MGGQGGREGEGARQPKAFTAALGGAGLGVDAAGLIPERPAVADAVGGVGGAMGCGAAGAARRMRASGGMGEGAAGYVGLSE